ncbi:MAG: hypothetical protein IJM96_01220 [Clostridia bacterium]|nr:hypothetical protein [Clostridia bacterium]MBQ6934637.1 hypothetical protein [Clostridia bacterium]MBQ7086080.1 hypothetical protein [Clostridia bacterium]MBQ7094635.1 hypothetical protein [Clostridia bacterium]
MNTRQFVLRETAMLAIGEAICTAAMVMVFALSGFYSTSVLLGGIIGCIMAVANFFFMAVSAESAADKAVAGDVKGGKALIKASFRMRLIAMAAIIILLARSGACNPIAMIVPLVLSRLVITVIEFFRKSGETK